MGKRNNGKRKKLYKRKYRVETVRLKDWDYSSNGYYFVTICIKNKELLFGNISNTQIELSKIGLIAKDYLIATSEHFQNTKIDEFVIMPNHIHSIIVLDNPNCRDITSDIGRDITCNVSTGINRFSQRISGSLPVIIQQYKSSVKRWCNKNNYSYFQWQRLYYEHIIQTEKQLNNIREYIATNILKWELDEYNPIKNKYK